MTHYITNIISLELLGYVCLFVNMYAHLCCVLCACVSRERAYLRADVCVSAYLWVGVCLRERMRACVSVCLSVCVCGSVYACLRIIAAKLYNK